MQLFSAEQKSNKSQPPAEALERGYEALRESVDALKLRLQDARAAELMARSHVDELEEALIRGGDASQLKAARQDLANARQASTEALEAFNQENSLLHRA